MKSLRMRRHTYVTAPSQPKRYLNLRVPEKPKRPLKRRLAPLLTFAGGLFAAWLVSFAIPAAEREKIWDYAVERLTDS